MNISRKLRVFDFDDTLAKTPCLIGVKRMLEKTNFVNWLNKNSIEVIKIDENLRKSMKINENLPKSTKIYENVFHENRILWAVSGPTVN